VSSSSAGRIAVWKASWAILREHPLGVGTGDVVPELMLRYECKGVTYAAERRLNPHNQWLQAGVAFGWPGILVLTWAFFSVFLWAWKERDVKVLLCLALVLFHASVESVLEVQRGVVFILWMFMSLAPAHRSDGSTVGVH
jgi:O-antigen ligase